MDPEQVCAFYSPSNVSAVVTTLRRNDFRVSRHGIGESLPIYDKVTERRKKKRDLVGFLNRGEEIEAYVGERLDEFMRAYQE